MDVKYLGLEGAPESNNKRVLGESEDVSLVENLLDLLLHDHSMLAHLLHGKPLVSLLVTNQVNSTGGREGGERERKRENRSVQLCLWISPFTMCKY